MRIRAGYFSLPELLFERDRVALGELVEGIRQYPCVRDDEDLGTFGRLRNEASQGGKQIGVEARFRFVQDEQTRWPWRQERRHPQQVTQRSIRKLGC